jgi:hypothetical protein
MSEPLFTPARARTALRVVRPATERLCHVFRRMEQTGPDHVLSDEPVPSGYFRLLRELNATVALLGRAGVRVRDLRQGLIGFPARRAGRRVWLCWQVGEPTVAWWHEIEAGFAGRHPIDDAGPWEEDANRPESAG